MVNKWYWSNDNGGVQVYGVPITSKVMLTEFKAWCKKNLGKDMGVLMGVDAQHDYERKCKAKNPELTWGATRVYRKDSNGGFSKTTLFEDYPDEL